MAVAQGVGALDVDDRHVGPEGGDQEERRAGPRIAGVPEVVVRGGDVAAEQGPRRNVGDAEGARQERQREREVRVVGDGEGMGLALLRRASVVMAEPRADVADPRRDHPPRRARADQLVEQHVRDRPDQREVALALADDLVAGRERDGRLEGRADADRRAVWHHTRDRVPQRDELGGGHSGQLYRLGRSFQGRSSGSSGGTARARRPPCARSWASRGSPRDPSPSIAWIWAPVRPTSGRGIGYVSEGRRLISALSAREDIRVPAWAASLVDLEARLDAPNTLMLKRGELASRRR